MSALVTVSKGAVIRILFQGQDRAWHQSRAEVEKITCPSELVLHATICAHRGRLHAQVLRLGLTTCSDSTMLLATHTSGQQILLYRVAFNFQRLAFDIQHLKTLNDCFPTAINSSNSESGASYTKGQLTHLEYFPQGPENRKGEPSRPFVLASFTSLPDPRSNGIGQEPYSVVCRWELHSTKPRIHSQFEQLSKKSSNSSPDLGVCIFTCVFNVTNLSCHTRPRLL